MKFAYNTILVANTSVAMLNSAIPLVWFPIPKYVPHIQNKHPNLSTIDEF